MPKVCLGRYTQCQILGVNILGFQKSPCQEIVEVDLLTPILVYLRYFVRNHCRYGFFAVNTLLQPTYIWKSHVSCACEVVMCVSTELATVYVKHLILCETVTSWIQFEIALHYNIIDNATITPKSCANTTPTAQRKQRLIEFTSCCRCAR